MNKKELRRSHIIKKAVDGEMTVSDAAKSLNLSTRRIKQLKASYTKIGDNAFIHGNKQRESPKKIDNSIIESIVNLRKKEAYKQANYNHFKELVEEELSIILSYQTIRRICVKANAFSPKKHKRRKKISHPTRKRKSLPGMLLQTDGSPYDWLSNGEKITLHGFIDDANNIITGLSFSKNECLYGYLEAFRQTLTNFGIPISIYPDKSSIFFYNPPKNQHLTIEEQLSGKQKHSTQFGRIVEELGINMFPASCAQAKGRIERLWQTLQSRLKVELLRNNIKTIEEANKFLPEYIKKYNKQFSIKAEKEGTAFVPISKNQIEETLCAKFSRRLDAGNTISFKNLKFKAENKDLPFKAKIEILIDFKYGIRGKYKENIFPLIPLDKYNKKMIENDEVNIPIVLKDFFEKIFLENSKAFNL